MGRIVERLHIIVLVRTAALFAVRHWSEILWNMFLMINSDNQSVVVCINLQGSTRSQDLDVILSLFVVFDSFNISVRAKTSLAFAMS